MYDDDDEDDDNDREDMVTCRGDQGEDQFPGESEEVHDVVSARGHLLLALLAFLAFFVVIWIKIRVRQGCCRVWKLIRSTNFTWDSRF